MKITINAKPKEVKAGNFNYSNIESPYDVNTQYFTKSGKPYTVIAGEMHFSRLPRERWRETLLKMRECGINTVSTYIFWNYHEEIKGRLRRWLCEICKLSKLAWLLYVLRRRKP